MARWSRLLFGVLVLALFSAPSARASSYLFSFTTAQLLSALDAVDSTHLQDGFFAIFIQAPGGYTVTQENSPDPTPGPNNDDWLATTIVNAGLGTGTWVEFARNSANGKNVTLVSDANNGGSASNNIFLNHTYSDAGTPPIGFGTQTPTATIDDIMASTAVFSFVLTGATITGSETFTGAASAIHSTSSSSFTGATTTTPNTFSITLSGTLLPEPATWVPLVSGVVFLLMVGMRRNKNRR
jgi:hypothetical protein